MTTHTKSDNMDETTSNIIQNSQNAHRAILGTVITEDNEAAISITVIGGPDESGEAQAITMVLTSQEEVKGHITAMIELAATLGATNISNQDAWRFTDAKDEKAVH